MNVKILFPITSSKAFTSSFCKQVIKLCSQNSTNYQQIVTGYNQLRQATINDNKATLQEINILQ